MLPETLSRPHHAVMNINLSHDDIPDLKIHQTLFTICLLHGSEVFSNL